MQNHHLSEVTDLSHCSKEELLDTIKKLQQENFSLLNKFQTAQIDPNEIGGMSYRMKYAGKILDALPDMLTVVTDNGTTVAVVSSEETNHSGILRENICGVHVRDFLPDHVYDHVMESIDQAIAHGKSENLNHLMYVDGKAHYYENRTVRIDNDHNLCLCRDITEEMTAKIQLESLNYAVNLVDENIFSLNAAGEFMFANKQFLDDHFQKESVVGKSAMGIMFSCQSISQWQILKMKIHANKGVLRYVHQHMNSDGGKISYEIITRSSHNINNEEEFWFFARNITTNLEQEKQINDLNDLLKAILNNIPLYLYVKDTTDYRYLYWNKALENLTGIPSKKAIGHTDDEIFANMPLSKRFKNNDTQILESNKKIENIEDIEDVNGAKRVIKAIEGPIELTDSEPLIFGVALDITDLKIVEKELINAKIEADKSNQLKSAFLANMSHEIRTPLNAIVGFSRLMMTEDEVESRQEYSNIIDRNTELLLQLINDILDLSKIEAGTLDFSIKAMDLDELCRDMYEIHRMRVNEGVSLIYESSNKSMIIHSDWNRLAQAFTNLLSNAIKFTMSGEIRFGFTVKSNYVEIYVRDTGMGISADKLPYIFDRFIKLNNFVQGTGLGLSITKTIIERLEGKITATSEKDKGTEFRFTIPYKDAIEEETVVIVTKPEIHKVKAPAAEGDKKVVLIAEDTDSNYLLLKKLIGNKYIHYHAQNGEEAVEMFCKYSPNIIFMDIKMPVMNGLEATKAIRTISTDVPIIALTAFAYASDKEDAIEAGCDHFLTKPIDFDQIQVIKDKYLTDK